MMDKKENRLRGLFQLRDRYIYLLLLAVSILVRIPFLRTYDMVTYDGTYYINQAKTILGTMDHPFTFPIGYPIFIALFIPLIRDGVRAAQTVSFLAGLGSLFVFYSLARQFVQRSNALVGVFILALTPLFINLSMVTMSESLYVFWVLLGFYCFSRNKDLLTGLSMGMAAITRSEALGILGVLAILRLRRPKSFLWIITGFACLFCVNVAVQSIDRGKLTIYPHVSSFGSSASSWKFREAWIDFPEREKIAEELATEDRRPTVLADYVKRVPREFVLLIRHVSPVIFLLSLYGVYQRRLFLLAAFLPFFVFPLFTTGSDSRFILPYVPMLILYSFIGMEGLHNRTAYRTLYALLIASSAAAFVVNRDQLFSPVSYGYQWAKQIGMQFRGRVKPLDKIGDRKPFFAFYAGGRYVEIPEAPYEETIENLTAQDVKYLVLDEQTIQIFRPQLLPLLYDRAVINGEMRFSQIFFEPSVGSIYQRTGRSEPVERRYLVPPVDGAIWGLSWSPDGRTIAYHLIEALGVGGIYTISLDGNQPRLVVANPDPEYQVAWAPDSKGIAFPMEQFGNTDIYIFNESGDLRRVTSQPGKDTSPSLSRDGKEIVFSSDQSGQSEIWSKNLETGALKQVTTNGGNAYPSISPDSKRIAWIRNREGLCIYERATGIITQAQSPKIVSFAPAWSPDGKFIAVTGSDWGNPDIYLLTADGRTAALLTKSYPVNVGMPAWSPDGQALAVATLQGKRMGVVILTGIQPYKDRLMNPIEINVLQPTERTR